MTKADEEENYEEDYVEYDEYDEEEDESGLSGFSVLMIGLVMFGAFAATTYVFYKKGIEQGERLAAIETPYVAADPEPIKIESPDSDTPVADREVYDVFDGEEAEQVTVIAGEPEEPVDRSPIDAIGDLAADVVDEAEDRVASLVAEDAEILDETIDEEAQAIVEAMVVPPTPTAAPKTDTQPVIDNEPAQLAVVTEPTVATSAISGTHVVQVGAYGSDDEATTEWARMSRKLGADVIDGKTYHIERADLGARGVYHRLRIGPFASSADAQDYCTRLKANGQDCLSKRK